MRPFLSYRKGSLWLEGVPCERVARLAGTPAYAYSAAAISGRLEALRRAFAGLDHLVCYALKANSNRAICRLLAGRGAGADIVSGGELRRALAAGFAPSRIVFSGVGKNDAELAAALKAGILALNVESAEELGRLSRIARRLRRRAPFALRVIPRVRAGAHAHISTGASESKFGIERGEALELYLKAARDPWLKPVGVQCHIGSQINELSPYRQALGALLDVVAALKARGIRLRHLDLGGGMGISYRGERPLDPGGLARLCGARLGGSGLRLLIEPGRFLVAAAGVLLTRVLLRKRSSRKRFVIVDAAMNDLARPALYGAYHEIVPASAPGRKRTTADVVGPVCETGDFIGRGRSLPWPKPGELWAVLDAGAYGFSMSSQYNSRPRAAEVLVSGRRVKVVREREGFADLVRHER